MAICNWMYACVTNNGRSVHPQNSPLSAFPTYPERSKQRHITCNIILNLYLIYLDRSSSHEDGYLGADTLSTTIGVRQGAPTASFLFTMFVNPLIRSLKLVKECLPGGFLQALHCLMLMDDTVILATSRGRCIEKLDRLVNFCTDSGMVMNTKKTKLMVINGPNADRQCISCHGSVIDQCDKYVYLGAMFTSDGITSPL